MKKPNHADYVIHGDHAPVGFKWSRYISALEEYIIWLEKQLEDAGLRPDC